MRGSEPKCMYVLLTPESVICDDLESLMSSVHDAMRKSEGGIRMSAITGRDRIN